MVRYLDMLFNENWFLKMYYLLIEDLWLFMPGMITVACRTSLNEYKFVISLSPLSPLSFPLCISPLSLSSSPPLSLSLPLSLPPPPPSLSLSLFLAISVSAVLQSHVQF